MTDEKFFQEKYFDDLSKRLDTIEGKIDKVNEKVWYMYAFAGGIGFAASFLWEFLKSHLFITAAPPHN